jgi:hypothetical protein
VLRSYELAAAPAAERTARRSITFSPAQGATVMLRARRVPAERLGALAVA